MPGPVTPGVSVFSYELATIVPTHEVVPGNAVAAAEALLEGTLLITRDIGMSEGVVAINIRVAMMLIVIASGLNSVTEAVATDIVVAVGECIPVASPIYDGRRAVV
jgi:hypothetical protein